MIQNSSASAARHGSYSMASWWLRMSDSQPNDRQRLIGGLLGVIVGDAIGVPWEFQPANTAPRPTPAVGFQYILWKLIRNRDNPF